MNIEQLKKKDKILRAAAAELNCEPAALPKVIEKFQGEIKATTVKTSRKVRTGPRAGRKGRKSR
jgi:hypothetical protein